MTKLTKAEALERIEDGHAVYSQEYADAICDALLVPRKPGHPMHSDPPGTFKGLTMKVDGEICVTALSLGHHACDHFGVKARAYHGRGSQGRGYADALRKHFDEEFVRNVDPEASVG